MYQEFFALNQHPFSISPNANFLYLTEAHKEALAHLTYGLQGNGGFVVLSGEVGTGKTTVCQFLLQDMPADTDIASITNPAVSEITLLVDICEQLKINYDHENISLKVMFDALSSWMLKNHQRGRHAIVLIDEAQHLSFKMLEQLRLLTNIESNNQKPLQIILVGQTELQNKLLTTELRQLSQRITARYHLRPLNKAETSFYIHHRLNTAGAKGPIFNEQAVPAIFKASQGIPGLINQICDRCLLTAYTHSSPTITASIAKKVINESDLPKKESPLKHYRFHATIALCVLSLALIIDQQTPLVIDYFDKSETRLKQQEWQRVIKTASQQPSSKNINNKDLSPEITVAPTTPIATLLAISESNYSLQLVALPNNSAVSAFFKRYPQLNGKTYRYHGKNQNKSNQVILLGNFASYKMARHASEKLQNDFPGINPWIKNYKTIHSDIK